MLTNTFLEAALNGSRTRTEHPGIPRTPVELTNAGRTSVAAGAHALHLHVYDDDDHETFAPEPTARTLRLVREACPDTPISLTTSEGIEPDPGRRLKTIAEWTLLPDLVTANMGEVGILDLCEHLLSRGVGIEAGLLSLDNAERFVASGIASRCTRVLVEPLGEDPDSALTEAESIEECVANAGIRLEQVHHGDGIASWAVNRRGLSRGHGIRTGLEDTTVMPDGSLAVDNAALVAAAVKLIEQSNLHAPQSPQNND